MVSSNLQEVIISVDFEGCDDFEQAVETESKFVGRLQSSDVDGFKDGSQ